VNRQPPIVVVAASRPDLESAAGAMLPMFLAFLGGRLKRAPKAASVEPVRADESEAHAR
jgi:hypothetical protein